MAREVYNQHIKAFNPDLKEPGREDKMVMTILLMRLMRL